MDELIDTLEKKLSSSLPGLEAQKKMAHSGRQVLLKRADTPKVAGVMILFFPVQTQWHIVLIERDNSNPNDKHRGQIGLPGGRREKSDHSIIQTALRETQEEVGVDSKSVNVLGKLTELYIPVSNYQVHPVVGFVEKQPAFTPQLTEVKSIIETPFDVFLENKNRQIKNLTIHEGVILENVPFFNVMGHTVWGATAMILNELQELFN